MATLGLGVEPPGALLRLGQQLLGLRAGAVHEDRGLLLSLPHGEVSGPLGQHQGAAYRVVVLVAGTFGDRSLGALGPVGKLAHLLLQLVDRDRYLLEELVDLVGVVAAKAVAELNFSQDFGRKIHVWMVSAFLGNDGGYRPARA